MYFWHYVACEALNAVIVVAMIFATDSFLGGRFVGYGTKVWDFYRAGSSGNGYGGYHQQRFNGGGNGGGESAPGRANPMCSLFPTVTS